MANIKINDVPQRIQYTVSSPSQSVFPIPFPFLENTDIVTYQDGIKLDQGSGAGQYGLSGAGTASGGTMTLVTAASTGAIITIVGAMPVDRTSIYSPTISNLTGDDLNNDFNSDIIMIKQQQTTQDFLQLQYAPWAEVSQDPDVTIDRRIPILPPGYCWVKNASNTAIEAVPFTGGGGGGGGTSVALPITQTAHGFVFGQIVYYNGVMWALGLADNAPDAEAIGCVTSITDANNFIIVIIGLIDGFTGLVPSQAYFLSDSVPGELTLTEPAVPGTVSKPLGVAISSTSLVFFNWRGKINAEPEFGWSTVTADAAMIQNRGYIVNGAGLINLTLPTSISAGEIIKIAGYSVGGWNIVQGAGQRIFLGNQQSTIGAGGSLASTSQGDCLELLCVVTDFIFVTLNSMGNITVT